ncbi:MULTISPECIES: DUF4406 domain-containing protein [Enterobacter cloacae complex]|uniref:DUF4406 domain-containing protein n=1 Tax=Enterobacteriaceae TaxID=543 RepID=UPI000797C10C|nr:MULTISPECIES: DUF4406 domain-containing protein [Enterobacter cloacae complex]HCJ7306090.1 DUF4406 domain-containing protein [Enterobacter hormaechei subsp. xiangfangensis]EJD6660007.1 DUF4406 domain-containing protein [Enterobacter cloacae]EKS6351468.1 DUF4406 domain-containing protein [Enterobacter hormaechei]EKY1472930.1 DUF4406 domain-containing protein [Enterobacter hormaechei]MBG0693105.1 DUF4406 domain-containing protein [Enterobacter hormaechei]
MKVYIAGPMTGRENFNRNAFNKEAERLTRHGHTVLNPASLPDGLEQREYMDICFAMLRCADAILMLPGWQTSSGATAEYHYAYKMELPVYSTLHYPPVAEAAS